MISGKFHLLRTFYPQILLVNNIIFKDFSNMNASRTLSRSIMRKSQGNEDYWVNKHVSFTLIPHPVKSVHSSCVYHLLNIACLCKHVY